MSYIKIADRNLEKKEVVIISKKLGTHRKLVRIDKINQYIFDYILFNKLSGTPYLVKET
jgi:hypothetical protein